MQRTVHAQPSIPLHYALSFAGVQMSGLQFNRQYSFHQSSIRMQNTSLNSSLSVHWPGTDGWSRNSAVTLKLIRVTGDYSKGTLSTVNIIVSTKLWTFWGILCIHGIVGQILFEVAFVFWYKKSNATSLMDWSHCTYFVVSYGGTRLLRNQDTVEVLD